MEAMKVQGRKGEGVHARRYHDPGDRGMSRPTRSRLPVPARGTRPVPETAPQRDPAELAVERRVLDATNRWLAARPGWTSHEYYREFDRLARWWKKRGEPLATLPLLTDADAQEFARYLVERMGPAGVSRTLAALSSLWRYLQTEGLTDTNPWRPSNVPRPPVPDRTADRILSEEEVQRMIAAAEAPQERALVLLLYHTGLRISEAVRARWEHVHRTPYGWTLTVQGKGGKTRTVGISVEALRACLALHDAMGVAPGSPQARWLLPGHSRDGHLARTSAERIIARVAKRAGVRSSLRPVSPHWLRHAHATHALQRGADVATVRAQLGHADLRTTTRYLHAQPEVTSTDFLPGASRRE